MISSVTSDSESVFLLNRHNHIHASLMASALKFCVDPFVNNHLRKLTSYHAGAEAKYIGIVVAAGHHRCVRLAAYAGAHAFYLVSCQ